MKFKAKTTDLLEIEFNPLEPLELTMIQYNPNNHNIIIEKIQYKAIKNEKFLKYETPFCFMIREHPTLNLIMIQIDNKAIQLNAKHQKRLYEYLKKKLEV